MNGRGSEHPELDRMLKASHESQIIGEFLDWLIYETEYVLAEREGFGLRPASFWIGNLLARYHNIDLDKVEEEKRAIPTEGPPSSLQQGRGNGGRVMNSDKWREVDDWVHAHLMPYLETARGYEDLSTADVVALALEVILGGVGVFSEFSRLLAPEFELRVGTP